MSDRCIYHDEHTKQIQENQTHIQELFAMVEGQSTVINLIHEMNKNLSLIAKNAELNSVALTDVLVVLKNHEDRLNIEENKEGQKILKTMDKLKLLLIGGVISLLFSIILVFVLVGTNMQ